MNKVILDHLVGRIVRLARIPHDISANGFHQGHIPRQAHGEGQPLFLGRDALGPLLKGAAKAELTEANGASHARKERVKGAAVELHAVDAQVAHRVAVVGEQLDEGVLGALQALEFEDAQKAEVVQALKTGHDGGEEQAGDRLVAAGAHPGEFFEAAERAHEGGDLGDFAAGTARDFPWRVDEETGYVLEGSDGEPEVGFGEASNSLPGVDFHVPDLEGLNAYTAERDGVDGFEELAAGKVFVGDGVSHVEWGDEDAVHDWLNTPGDLWGRGLQGLVTGNDQRVEIW